MTDQKISRRQLITGAVAGLAAVPAATLLARRAEASTLISESDPQAKSLGYLHDAGQVDPKANPTFKPGQDCANCIQYTGKAGAAEGPCNIFPGKLVKAKGWCKVWVLKPGMKL